MKQNNVPVKMKTALPSLSHSWRPKPSYNFPSSLHQKTSLVPSSTLPRNQFNKLPTNLLFCINTCPSSIFLNRKIHLSISNKDSDSSMVFSFSWHFLLALFAFILFTPNATFAHMNVIDQCWRSNPNWRRHRLQLAQCSVGFAGKMTNNIGEGVVHYKVTDPFDDPLNPKPGSLRYGATMVKGKVWITFKRDMQITLHKPVLISSFTAIDGRGVDIHIIGPACLLAHKATDVIIHGLRIHHCKRQSASSVMGPEGKVVQLGQTDGDAIRLVTATKVWIDHNTLHDCEDGLLDVTRGSTNITISNNWFRNQDKVMLLGHDDGYVRDKGMRATVVFNHFGPNCNQRMPRVRHGFAHVANNLYQGWEQYAIGGSMSPSIVSEANFFIAPEGNKEVTWRQGNSAEKALWKFYSVGDLFTNGASFKQTGITGAKPNYNREQSFKVANADEVKVLTSSSGVLKCSKTSGC